jgi:hypothetical protein
VRALIDVFAATV